MKSFSHFSAFVVIFSTFSLGCVSHHKNARNTASVASSTNNSEIVDPTMVNVVSSSRMPSANGSLNVDLPSDPVSVSANLVQLPGDPVAHASLLFSVKKSPDVAGQISGNTEGSETSKKFVRVVQKMMSEGVNAAAATAIVAAQNRFKSIPGLPPEERTEALKSALYEVRDKLLAAY